MVWFKRKIREIEKREVCLFFYNDKNTLKWKAQYIFYLEFDFLWNLFDFHLLDKKIHKKNIFILTNQQII